MLKLETTRKGRTMWNSETFARIVEDYMMDGFPYDAAEAYAYDDMLNGGHEAFDGRVTEVATHMQTTIDLFG